MPKKYRFILLLVFIMLPLFSTGNAFLCYRIPRETGTTFGDYHEYSGVMHVHTTYSDGGGTYDEIGDIADSLGLHFVIPCDHNTVEPHIEGRGGYHGGTAIIPGVEISTHNSAGHFLVLGDSIPIMPGRGVSSDSVFNEALRDDSTIFLAHVYHNRKRLDWDNWSIGKAIRMADRDTLIHAAMISDLEFIRDGAPLTRDRDWDNWDIGNFTGFELFNLDENWRENLTPLRAHRLVGGLAAFLFTETALNSLISYPERQMQQFDTLCLTRKIAGIGSTDAHSNLKLTSRRRIRYPSYESQFNLVHTVIITRRSLTGDYLTDRTVILDALRSGNSYVGISGLENARGFLFSATNGHDTAIMGEHLRIDKETSLSVQLPDSSGVLLRIFRNGRLFRELADAGSYECAITRPGVYRAEVFQSRYSLPFLTTRRLPWIISNPIYIYNMHDDTTTAHYTSRSISARKN